MKNNRVSSFENLLSEKNSDLVIKIYPKPETNPQEINVTVYDKNKNIYREQSHVLNEIEYWYIPNKNGTLNVYSKTNERIFTSEYIKKNGISILKI